MTLKVIRGGQDVAASEEAGKSVGEEDAEWVRRAIAGEVYAKEQLYRRYSRYAVNLGRRLMRTQDAGEDVAQDAFVLAFEQLRSLREPAAFRGWFTTILVRQAHRKLARRRVARVFGLDKNEEDSGLAQLAAQDASPDVRADLGRLDQVLAAVVDTHRIAWMLRRIDDEDLEDVATHCGCSLATVKRWISAVDDKVAKEMNLSFREGAE